MDPGRIPRRSVPLRVRFVGRVRLGMVFAACLGAAVHPAGAQEQPVLGGVHLRFGGGLGRGSLGVGGTTGTRTGIVVGVEASGVRGRWRTWAVDAQIEPYAVPNLVRAEHYRAFTVLANRFFFKALGLGLGFQSRFWGGDNPYVGSDWGPALGVTLTTPLLEVGDWLVSSDLVWRGSGGDEITTSVVGLRVFLGRRRTE